MFLRKIPEKGFRMVFLLPERSREPLAEATNLTSSFLTWLLGVSVCRARPSSAIAQLVTKRPGLRQFEKAAWKTESLPLTYTLCLRGFGLRSHSEHVPMPNWREPDVLHQIAEEVKTE